MNVKRLKAIAKLGLLFGIPISLVLGLFSWGVHVGAQHRHAIASFERDWLGLDVEVPDPPAEAPPAEETTPAASEDEPPAPPAPDPPAEDPPVPREEPTPKEREERQPLPEEPPAIEPAVPETRAEPLQGELAERYALPVKVHVKVLVDPELIDRQPQWIDYVQRTVGQASRIYQKQFGIELELVAVGRWPIATEGMGARALRDDLEARSRESADMLLAFTHRPLASRLDPPEADSDSDSTPFNGAYAVVHASSATNGHDAHVRTMLREVGRMFGARDIVDAEDPDWQAGSWMSHATVAPSQAPWIDGANRRRILERKDKPFRPETPQE